MSTLKSSSFDFDFEYASSIKMNFLVYIPLKTIIIIKVPLVKEHHNRKRALLIYFLFRAVAADMGLGTIS